jgi:hypothetical protein
MQLNGTDLVDRNNRPNVIQKVAIRTFFINDGVYTDPSDISGVTIFRKSANYSPSSILDSQNLIASSVLSSNILMHFGASANDAGAALAPTSYNPNDMSSLSGIYRVAQGEYVCVLDGAAGLSGAYDFHGSALVVTTGASAVDDYIDVWTVQFAAGSDYNVIINDFHLYEDTFFSITEPLLFTASNKLITKHVTLGSNLNLKVATDVTIHNRDVDESIKNLFCNTTITSAMAYIQKVNEKGMGSCEVDVSSYAQTSALVSVTSDNTILVPFNASILGTHANIADFGGTTGMFSVKVKYTLLNETIESPVMYFTVS